MFVLKLAAYSLSKNNRDDYNRRSKNHFVPSSSICNVASNGDDDYEDEYDENDDDVCIRLRQTKVNTGCLPSSLPKKCHSSLEMRVSSTTIGIDDDRTKITEACSSFYRHSYYSSSAFVSLESKEEREKSHQIGVAILYAIEKQAKAHLRQMYGGGDSKMFTESRTENHNENQNQNQNQQDLG